MRVGTIFHSDLSDMIISSGVTLVNNGVSPVVMPKCSNNAGFQALQPSVTDFLNKGVDGDFYQIVYFEANLGAGGQQFIPKTFFDSFPRTKFVLFYGNVSVNNQQDIPPYDYTTLKAEYVQGNVLGLLKKFNPPSQADAFSSVNCSTQFTSAETLINRENDAATEDYNADNPENPEDTTTDATSTTDATTPAPKQQSYNPSDTTPAGQVNKPSGFQLTMPSQPSLNDIPGATYVPANTTDVGGQTPASGDDPIETEHTED